MNHFLMRRKEFKKPVCLPRKFGASFPTQLESLDSDSDDESSLRQVKKKQEDLSSKMKLLYK
ncbi:Uncharacterised protein g11432, partial [Pycnogonum litorale]